MSESQNSVVYRTPPLPPSTTQSTSQAGIAKNSATTTNVSGSSGPPQPPARTNLNRSSSQADEDGAHTPSRLLQKVAKESTPTPPSRAINQHNYDAATSAAAKLVYKSAMTGSVQSLNNSEPAVSSEVQSPHVANLSQQMKNVS